MAERESEALRWHFESVVAWSAPTGFAVDASLIEVAEQGANFSEVRRHGAPLPLKPEL